MTNEFVCEFATRIDLIEAVVAGCFIPFWFGSFKTPEYKGRKYVDGGFTNNEPRFTRIASSNNNNNKRQVRLCAFASLTDVSPRSSDDCMLRLSVKIAGTYYAVTWANVGRALNALLPPPISSYARFIEEGHANMKDFVLRNNLIKCVDCHAAAVGVAVINDTCEPGQQHNAAAAAAVIDQRNDAKTARRRRACLACLKLIERVHNLKVSDDLMRVLTEAAT